MLAANSNSDEDEILCRCWQYNTGRQSVSGEGMNDGAVTVERIVEGAWYLHIYGAPRVTSWPNLIPFTVGTPSWFSPLFAPFLDFFVRK